MTDPARAPSIDDVRAAARRVSALAWRTPLLPSPWLSALTGADVRLKLESVQRTGSFKIRGAVNALARLRELRPDVRAVVTASAGNHGQAIALAAACTGLTARVFLPATAPDAKKQAIRRFGAEIVETESYDAAETAARAAASASAPWVSPYNDADVMAGAGTAALEMFEDEPDLDVIVTPIGGGGLAAGCAIVVAGVRPSAMVIATEADRSPVFTTSLAAGAIVPVDVHPTLADGLTGNLEPGSRTFPLVRDLVHRVVLVREASIALAMRELVLHERLVAEGAAATAIAALLDHAYALPIRDRTVGVILSGRNVDGAVIAGIIAGRDLR